MYYDITRTVPWRRVGLDMRGDVLAGSGHTPQLEHYYWLHRAVPFVKPNKSPCDIIAPDLIASDIFSPKFVAMSAPMGGYTTRNFKYDVHVSRGTMPR